LRETSLEVLEETAQKSDLAKRIYESIKEATFLFQEWAPLAEQGFLKHRLKISAT